MNAEGAPIGIFKTDAAGRCTYTNARWQAIYGMGFDEPGDGEQPALLSDGVTVLIASASRPLLQDTELGQRGYVITGNQDFLIALDFDKIYGTVDCWCK